MTECNYNLLPAQRQFLEIPHDYDIDVALYQGGYGSGKTFAGSLLGTLLCLKYPKIRGLVGAQTIKLVTDTTLVSYKEHFEKMGLKYTHNKSSNIITLENGSEILFRHLEEPDKIKSLNLGFVEIEEMSDVPQSTFEMLLARLRQEKRPEWGDDFRYRLFGHTNPESRKGWIYEKFVEKPRPNFRRIIAPTTDNIYLPKGFVQTLKDTYDEDYYRVNVLGEDVDFTKGLVTKHFNRDLQLRSDLKIRHDMPLHITCDFNKDPMCWYICQHYDGDIYVLHEVVTQHATTEGTSRFVAEELLTGYKDCKIIINGDASGKSDTTKGSDYLIMQNIFKQAGYDVKLAVMNKNPDIGWRTACWNRMFLGPDNKPHVFIHPSCVWLIYNIENFEMEEGGSRPKRISTGKLRVDPRAKYLGHPFDAVSYLICLYYPIKPVDLKAYQGPPMLDVFGNKYTSGV
mgnify:CR=1 FL=1|jgi:PBSX family phage terminase large subunit